MKIKVVTGVGIGRTLLSAFDTALKDAGVCNYNLIALSSVIPPYSQVGKIEGYQTPDGDYGHRLYVIQSDIRGEERGKGLAAGLGWYQLDSDNRGMFCEHKAEAATEEEARKKVEEEIKESLSDFQKSRGIPVDQSKFQMAISSVTVGDQPTCVLAIAVYQSQSWE